MSIYSKKTLSIILIMTLLISVGFYFYNKQEHIDKNDLYQNKINSNKKYNANKNYGVSTNNIIAENIGKKILEDGGNAVDAMVGVSYALAVVEPHSSGLGGGGSTLYYDGKQGSIPKQIQYKDISSINYNQNDEIGIPGFVKGVSDLHQKEGKMEFKKIMNYVIPLADDGFEIDSELEKSLKLYSKDIDRDSPFFKNGIIKREGEIVKQPELTKTLKGIRDDGPDYFYNNVGKSLSKQLEQNISYKDFKLYKSKYENPVKINYLNNEVYSASNPLGGTLMLQGLILDNYSNIYYGNNTEYDYVSSVLKGRTLMYKNRDIVNDVDKNVYNYLTPEYIQSLLFEINQEDYNSQFNVNNVNNTSTTHFVVVDKNGMMVSTTNTLSSFFGSGKFTKEGFYLNNSLTNFSKDKSSPNYGAKNKIPRSYTSPSIIIGDDYYLGIGTPGGNKIPTILNETIIEYLNSNKSLQQVIDEPRFYNDNQTVYYERGSSKERIKAFKELGFKTELRNNDPNYGSVQAIKYHKDKGTVEIGSDVTNR
ncbi:MULTISPECIES: gamma-glutamyltransferase [unclassified Mammaliicoccus]|uniref:gamma-glutamyltransferase n=1 Tax=unclassified Mammaliicoccus TaxID=2803851 RepID=UPI001EFA778D|nr:MULTISPECIES: gamma-glutamyltransferase [unclassified Mammaliicoccus]